MTETMVFLLVIPWIFARQAIWPAGKRGGRPLLLL
eukprot:SAG25_NODE_12762_length_275_cov_0.914773_1_plen_34_part_01